MVTPCFASWAAILMIPTLHLIQLLLSDKFKSILSSLFLYAKTYSLSFLAWNITWSFVEYLSIIIFTKFEETQKNIVQHTTHDGFFW